MRNNIGLVIILPLFCIYTRLYLHFKRGYFNCNIVSNNSKTVWVAVVYNSGYQCQVHSARMHALDREETMYNTKKGRGSNILYCTHR